jgi:hypothetical protein
MFLNTSNAKLNPACHLLTLLRAHHILHVSRIRVNLTTGWIFVVKVKSGPIDRRERDPLAPIPVE